MIWFSCIIYQVCLESLLLFLLLRRMTDTVQIWGRVNILLLVTFCSEPDSWIKTHQLGFPWTKCRNTRPGKFPRLHELQKSWKMSKTYSTGVNSPSNISFKFERLIPWDFVPCRSPLVIIARGIGWHFQNHQEGNAIWIEMDGAPCVLKH